MRIFSTLLRKTKTIDKEILRAFVAFIIIICVGTVAYGYLEGWSILDASYFSVITLTTIGYGDMHPTQPATKLFTMGYVFFGVGLVFYIFTSITHHLFEDEKKEMHHIEQEIERLEELLKAKRT